MISQRISNCSRTLGLVGLVACLLALGCGMGETSPEEAEATRRIQEFQDECEATCPLEDCKTFCDCTVSAYRDKLGPDLAVITFMDEVDAKYQSGDIRGSQESVREFFEACQHLITLPTP